MVQQNNQIIDTIDDILNEENVNTKPTYRDIEKALINIIKAGFYYRKLVDGKFLQNYKNRLTELRQAEDLEKYILNKAKNLFPNEEKYNQMKAQTQIYYQKEPSIHTAIENLYKLYYIIAKNHFVTESEIELQADDFINS